MVFINEFIIWKVLDTTQYDTIYHEHLRYYSIRSQQKLFSDYNIKIFHAKIPTHGGSIRIFASKKNYRISYNAKSLINRESKGKKLRTELNLFKKSYRI